MLWRSSGSRRSPSPTSTSTLATARSTPSRTTTGCISRRSTRTSTAPSGPTSAPSTTTPRRVSSSSRSTRDEHRGRLPLRLPPRAAARAQRMVSRHDPRLGGLRRRLLRPQPGDGPGREGARLRAHGSSAERDLSGSHGGHPRRWLLPAQLRGERAHVRAGTEGRAAARLLLPGARGRDAAGDHPQQHPSPCSPLELHAAEAAAGAAAAAPTAPDRVQARAPSLHRRGHPQLLGLGDIGWCCAHP
ncbi:hypothetical protein PMAYCL1PPCAC_05559 [Pristionchus mayeri]|uniref:Uncharacterized protein n=1 Tax=Pristionchus mayeri TaxID=1317129 RepID=A0AAN4Z8K5_9BILA|nr:hypothetical protein PMAYCL1PPCAC_05559 [Pristionchus mayeri]